MRKVWRVASFDGLLKLAIAVWAICGGEVWAAGLKTQVDVEHAFFTKLEVKATPLSPCLKTDRYGRQSLGLCIESVANPVVPVSGTGSGSGARVPASSASPAPATTGPAATPNSALPASTATPVPSSTKIPAPLSVSPSVKK